MQAVHSSTVSRTHNLGLLIIRLGIGLAIMYYGYPKLIGGMPYWTSEGLVMKNIGIAFLPAFWGFLIAGVIHILSLNVMIPIVRRDKNEWMTLILILLSACWILGVLISMIIITFQGSEFNWLFQSVY